MGISIIENSDLFVRAAPSNEEMHHAKFHFKEDGEDFVSDEELHRELDDDYSPPCSKLTYEADRQAAKQRILERRFPEQIQRLRSWSKLQVWLKNYILLMFSRFNLYYIIL